MVEAIQQLSANMAAGNADAVEAFYRQYFDWMYSQARRATKRDEAFCLDVVQDAVLRVMRTVKAVESERRFLGWLRLVVQTTAFDLLRSEKRRKNREAMAGTSAIDMDTDSLQLDWLHEQISSLDPELVKIIELRFEQSWTLRRIGETLGISVGAVDGRLRRALHDIRLAARPESVEVEPAIQVEGQTPEVGKNISEVEQPEVIGEPSILQDETLPPVVVVEGQAIEPIAVPLVTMAAITQAKVVAIEPIPMTQIVAIPASVAKAIVEQITAAPMLDLVDLPIQQTTVEALTLTSFSVDTPELIHLDDEAGAYDDRL